MTDFEELKKEIYLARRHRNVLWGFLCLERAMVMIHFSAICFFSWKGIYDGAVVFLAIGAWWVYQVQRTRDVYFEAKERVVNLEVLHAKMLAEFLAASLKGWAKKKRRL